MFFVCFSRCLPHRSRALNVGRKYGRRKTALLASTKFAWSGHPANILLTSYGWIDMTVSGYQPSSTPSGNTTSTTLSRTGRGGGGDHANVLETDITVIDAMGSIHPLFDTVAPIRLSHERCRDSSQNASHASTRAQLFEGPEANLACSERGHPEHTRGNTRTALYYVMYSIG